MPIGGPQPMKLVPEPLTAEAFAPFGRVLSAPAQPGRISASDCLQNLRPGARVQLTLSTAAPKTLPLVSKVMERHEFSSQTFMPLDASSYVVVVAPHSDGRRRPDMGRARAFLVRGDQGISYGADVWHHPMTALDREARFAVLMWTDGTSEDEEFIDLDEPIEIAPA